MSFSFHTPLWIALLCLAAAVAAAVYTYRFTVPRVSTSKRFVLIGLRSLALSCILIALFESQYSISTGTTYLPAVAVLIDNSLSMTQTDNGKNKEELTRRLLSGSSFAGLAKKTDLKLFQFSSSLSPLLPESLKCNGGSTNISTAIEDVQQITSSQLHGILLVTDGNYNAGTNPLYSAEKSPMPYFIVGVGDTIEQKDIVLSKISANTVGYAGTSLPVDVVVTSTGIPSTPVTVSLFEDAKKIGDQLLRISSDESGVVEFPVHFIYTPSEAGIKKLTARVSAVRGEYTDKNNVRFSTVKILKSKLKVAIVAGAPNPDVSAIMQSLSLDKNIESVLYTQFPNGELHSLQTTMPAGQYISSADCLILEGYPTSVSPDAVIHSIITAIATHSLSTLFIAGRSIDLHKVSIMESVLPFTVNAGTTDEQTVLPVLSSQYRLNTLVRPNTEMFPGFSWDKLPPIYTSLSGFVEKPESKKLLTAKIQGVPLKTPLFLAKQSGKTKSLAFLGYGIFRWQLLAGSVNDTRGFFPVWFSSLVRWLSTSDDDKLFHVEPEQEIAAEGEQIGFSGQVFNDTYDPIDNADIQLSIRSSSGEQVSRISFASAGSGRYTATAPPLAQGDYTYSSTAMISGDTLATTGGRFSVGEQSIEFAETRMNKPLLQQMAHASSGMYVNADRFDDLIVAMLDRPEMKPVVTVHTNEFQLWNLPAWMAVIIIFFGIEWFIRKRSGML